MTDDNEHIEIEINSKKYKNLAVFILILKDDSIWVNTDGLLPTAFLCACLDGVDLYNAKVGENGDIDKTFVSIDWAINVWGGPKDIVNALKKRKKMTIDDLPRLKEKYKK